LHSTQHTTASKTQLSIKDRHVMHSTQATDATFTACH
jgi:hypothetical protein